MKYKNNIWGEALEIKESNIKEIKKKTESKKKVKVVNEKSLKSKTVSIEDKLVFINEEVLRILGVYKDNTQVIRTKEDFISYIDAAINNGIIAIDTETDNSLDPLTCLLMGPCIYTPGQKNAYIPIHHTDLNNNLLPNQLTEEDVREQFSRLINTKIIMHNGKFDYKVIYCTCGIKLNCYWDTMIGSRILNENERAGLKEQYIKKIDPSIEKYSIDHLFTVPYQYVDPEIFALYAATDSFMTYKLYELQLAEFTKEDNSKIYKLFRDVEMPIMTVSAEMELMGICIDKEYSERLSKKYHDKLDIVNKQIEEELNKLKPTIDIWRTTKEALNKPLTKAGKEGKSKSEQLMNPPETTSPTQLSILLYDILKLPVIDKENPRGTGTEILEKMEHPICKVILEQRTILKMIDAFIDELPKLVSPRDSRLHSNFNQLGTDTGRFSSTNPNLQQIPSRNNEIRLMFKATDGYVFVGADFSAQEPRLTTFLSQDPAMLKAYDEDKDLYATIGTGVWNNDYWDNMEHYEDGSPNVEGKKRRSKCKKLLLGITYGMGPATTAQNMKVSLEEAKEIIEKFYKGFPKVKELVENNEKFVVEHGYVEDIYGRRRRLPDAMLPEREFSIEGSRAINPLLNSNSNYISDEDKKLFASYNERLDKCRSQKERNAINEEAARKGIKIRNNGGFISRAKRQCTNARIQGSAATMTKKAMILIHNDELMHKLGFRLLIGVHDELIGECPIENAEAAAERLSYLMSHSVEDVVYNVKFKCDAEIEDHWYLNTYAHTVKAEYDKYVSKFGEEEAFNRILKDHSESTEDLIKDIISGNIG